MDHRRLICPRPPSPILLDGCIVNDRIFPPHPLNWVLDDYLTYNPPADVARPLRNKDWLNRGLRKGQQAVGLLPLKPPGGAILHEARARAERTYQDWKWAVDAL